MPEPWILAVDLGTGGPKTGAVSLSGELLGQSVHSVRTRYLPDGGAVQDPADWWRAITADVRKLTAAKQRNAALQAAYGKYIAAQRAARKQHAAAVKKANARYKADTKKCPAV